MQRYRLLRNCLVGTLLLSCLVLTHAAAAEPSSTSWFGRMFKGNAVPEAEKDNTGKKAAPFQAEAQAAKKLRAELDWKRRAEACQKLREVAAESNDAGLERLAERLDQRAWDAYLRQAGPTAARTLDEPTSTAKKGADTAKKRGDETSQAKIREVQP